jgi:transcription elongation factor SPT6
MMLTPSLTCISRPGEVGVDEGQYKRPKRKSLYSVCSKAGLWEVASKFGYSSEQFGLQLSLEKMVNLLFTFNFYSVE